MGNFSLKSLNDSDLGQYWLVKPLNTDNDTNSFVLISLLSGLVLRQAAFFPEVMQLESFNGSIGQVLVNIGNGLFVTGNASTGISKLVPNPTFQ